MSSNMPNRRAQQPDINNQVRISGDRSNLNINVSASNDFLAVVDSKGTNVDSSKPNASSALGMEQEIKRLATFKTWPHSASVSVFTLARAGFYFMGIDDQLQCFACLGIIKDWEYGDTAMGKHRKHFPRCPFVLDTNYKNVPLVADYTKLGATSDPSAEDRASEKAAGFFKASSSESKKELTNETAKGKQVKDSGFDDNLLTSKGNPIRRLTRYLVKHEVKSVVCSEYNRLLSFWTWPQKNPFEPQDLAKAGFYYLKMDDIVQCFACFGTIKDWEPNNSPMQEHTRRFPNCPFVLGLDAKNIPITPLQMANVSIEYREPSGFTPAFKQFSKEMETTLPQTAKVASRWEQVPSPDRVLDKPKYPQYSGENARLATFSVGWPGVLGILPQELARAGFFFTGEEDSTKCFYCGGGLKRWAFADKPWTEHAKQFPVCEWLLQQKGQTFVSYIVRNNPVDTSQLQRDQVSNKELARSKPAPSSTGQAASSQASASATMEPPEEKAGVACNARPADKHVLLDKAMNSRLTQRVLEMGYDFGLVKRVIQHRLQTAGKEFDTTNDLLEAVWQAELSGVGMEGENEGEDGDLSELSRRQESVQSQDPGTAGRGHMQESRDREHQQSLEDLKRKIERLQDENSCKVCMDNEANTVLKPCMHLVVCDTCIRFLQKCPICQRTITSVDKVFKS